MNTINPLVEKQYTEWVYPEPIADVAVWAANHCQICDPSLHYALIWPERLYNPKLSILVAGCGTSQAAILAYMNPQATIVGIDLSPTSISCSAKLKTKHNLGNLALHQMDLHNVSTFGRKFDLVYGTGVLHHLPDPQKGLEALSHVVDNNGVMCVMLYSKYARAGIYMVQEALRRMGLDQTPDDVALTRHIIDSLPPWHLAQPYLEGAQRDLAFDGGVVDTFLHKQDRAFSVPDILNLTAACDLSFQGWTDNLDYYPDGAIPTHHPAYQKIASLPDEEQWAIVELLAQFSGFHSFLLRKKSGNENNWRIDFNNRNFLQWIPAHRHLLQVTDEQGIMTLSRSRHTSRIQGLERDLFLAIDGTTTSGAILKAYTRGSTAAEKRAWDFFAHMWRLGHLTFSSFSASL